MGQLDHFPGQGDVILEGQAGAVDHNGGIASVHGGDAGFHGFAVVQVEGYGDGTVFCVLFDGLGDVVRADLLIFQCAVGEVCAAAHKGVCQIRALNNGGGAEHLMNLDDGFGLGNGVDVKRALGVIVFFRCFQNGSHRYQ